MARVDDIEISPIIALDDKGEPTTYTKAKGFEVCEEGQEVAWGVYTHKEGRGAKCLFDVVDKANALLAEKKLRKLYKLD